MAPRIIYKAGFTVVGLVHMGEIKDGSKDALWEELGRRYKEIPQADPDIGFGVHTKADGELRYLAGLRAGHLGELPAGMIKQAFPPHVYAVFTHRGRMEALPSSIDSIFQSWLPTSSYNLDGEYYFEYYDDRFQPNSRDSVIFLWVPVREKEI